MSHEVWLLDHSSSMAGERHRRLKEQMEVLHRDNPSVKLIAFNHAARAIVNVRDLPMAGGSTAIHLALETALAEFPGKVVVCSDGCPDDPDAALEAARMLPGVVDTIFFGDEDDKEAKQFMEKLARDNGGRWIFKDILKNETLLCGEVRELLGLPAPIAL